MPETVVVALGGHALVRPGQSGRPAEQRANLRSALCRVVDLLRQGDRVLIVHGNGPQVGNILDRNEAARGIACDLSLDVCVAQSQGEIGYLIQSELDGLLRSAGIDRPTATLLTRVEVDPHDPRMSHPTKPVGPFHSASRADELRRDGLPMVEDAGRGYRRVVTSPKPTRVVEAEVVKRLMESGTVVIAGGGGGIPVVRRSDGSLEGVEAVVDKDHTATLLAIALGAERLLNLTAVEFAQLNFGTPNRIDLGTIDVDEARAHLEAGHFAPGSMQPKIEAAVEFLERGGREVVITVPERAPAGGTHIVDRQVAGRTPRSA